MPAPLINLDIRDVSHNRALAPSSSYGFNFKSATRLSISRRFPRHSCYDTIQYPYHLSSTGVSYTIRSSSGVVQKHTLEHTHISSRLLGSIKFFLGYSIGASWQGQGNTRYLQYGHINLFVLLNSTQALFSMDSRISYHWEGSDGAAWWGRRLDDTLMFSCSGLTKSSVL